jgi:hypothetical protein
MKLLVFILLMVSTSAYSWTLNSSARYKYSVNDIKVYIGSDTCANAGLTPATLELLVKDAIDQYWSNVAPSALNISSAGPSSISVNGDTTLTASANKTYANTIIVGCNSSMPDFSTHGILGVGGMACSGDTCWGALTMNNAPGTAVATQDRATIVNAVAHELGHALGLGHTSVHTALMYYNLNENGKVQKTLHQDDIDGITYLFPNDKTLSGLAGACGTISLDQKEQKNFWISFLIGCSLLFLFNINRIYRLIHRLF